MLRINIRLVDTTTNQQLWSERFERPFGDLFAVQDEIVRRLTELLPGKMTDAERQRLANRYTRSLEAYDYFLRAQALFLVRQAGVNEEARNLYRKALEMDPKFARAYAGLAMTYAMDHRLRPPGEASTALARAFELAESARMIDPEFRRSIGRSRSFTFKAAATSRRSRTCKGDRIEPVLRRRLRIPRRRLPTSANRRRRSRYYAPLCG